MGMAVCLSILGSGANGHCSWPRRCSRFEIISVWRLVVCHPLLSQNVAVIAEQLVGCASTAPGRGNRRDKNAWLPRISREIKKRILRRVALSGVQVTKVNEDARFLDTAKRGFDQVPRT